MNVKPEQTSNKQPVAIVFAASLIFFAFTFFLQQSTGTYASEFAGHPDEAAHVVTSLMVRDYMVEGLPKGKHPMRFAEDYYERLPKVALGHYPPGFYAIVGTALVPFRSATTILVMSALFSAIAATLLWLIATQFFNRPTAFIIACAFCLLPLIREFTAIVMSDLLLTCFLLGATLAWSKFMRDGKLSGSIAFGILAAAAILTKGSGILLAALPPLTILISRRFDLLKNWRLWMAPIPVVLTAAPWTALTLGISSEGWVFESLSEYLAAAAVFFPAAFIKEFGYTVLVFATIGIGYFFKRVFSKHTIDPLANSLAALGISVALCYTLIPSGIEERYLIPLVPLVLLAAAFGVTKIAGLIKKESATVVIAAAFLMFAIMIAERHQVDRKNYSGMEQVLTVTKESLQPDQQPSILISSGPRGEGALIALAALDKGTNWHIYRGSKSLATSDWIGRDYQSEIDTPEKLASYLRGENISVVVADASVAEKWRLPHHNLLLNSIHDDRSTYQLFTSSHFTGHKRDGEIVFAKVLSEVSQ